MSSELLFQENVLSIRNETPFLKLKVVFQRVLYIIFYINKKVNDRLYNVTWGQQPSKSNL